MGKEFVCEIVEHIAVLGKRSTVTVELNRVRFGNADPRFDIRGWYRTADAPPKPLKGTQLTLEEVAALRDALNERTDIPKKKRPICSIFRGQE